ncbi:MAG: diaminopimelate decarboxylase [Cellvibrionaceae bacterium]
MSQTFFLYRDGNLFAENCQVADLAREHGTPLYIYSRAAFTQHYQAYQQALGNKGLACYAVKANSNIGVLSVLAKLGAGFDIVSQGELERVLLAGGQPGNIVFSGVGKTASEMHRAMDVGIKCFNVESLSELRLLGEVAQSRNEIAPISLRVNPDVDAKTHPYISTGLKDNKFGIGIEQAPAVYREAEDHPHLNVVGVDCHIGSQLTETQPFLDALDRVLLLIDQLASDGIHVHHLDLGGGLGVTYDDETPPSPGDYISQILTRLEGRNLELILEPGRSVAANAGIFITKVEFLKLNDHKNFAVIDGAMNDNLRPALYSAWQRISPATENAQAEARIYDVVGPVCETGDFLGKDRELAIEEGDLLCMFSSGAYGFTMSSNYNTRPRAAELMVDGDQHQVIRQRETLEDLVRGETVFK